MAPGSDRPVPNERYLAINDVDLFVREIGTGHPVVVLHGGPDFDHTYLLPELDVLSDCCRLIYYDQRGRGRSAPNVAPEQVTIYSEIADLDQLRDRLGIPRIALLGHSWGAVIAMEYAARHPDRISHLMLMNPAPASGVESIRLRDHLTKIRSAEDRRAMADIAASAPFRAGDPQAETDFYRIHFRPTVNRGELDQVVGRLRTHFTAETVRTASAIEHRLYEQTWLSAGYDVADMLADLQVPTLVLHSERDFIPISMAYRIADAIPGAVLIELEGCGHFAFAERPELIHRLVGDFVSTP